MTNYMVVSLFRWSARSLNALCKFSTQIVIANREGHK